MPPVAVTVMLLGQVEATPIPPVQLEKPVIEAVPAPEAVPLRLALPAVPCAREAFKVTLREPEAAGLKVTVPNVQEAPEANVVLAQVPGLTVKSAALLPLRVIGVALSTMGPAVAVMVALPVQALESPTVPEQVIPEVDTVALP